MNNVPHVGPWRLNAIAAVGALLSVSACGMPERPGQEVASVEQPVPVAEAPSGHGSVPGSAGQPEPMPKDAPAGQAAGPVNPAVLLAPEVVSGTPDSAGVLDLARAKGVRSAREGGVIASGEELYFKDVLAWPRPSAAEGPRPGLYLAWRHDALGEPITDAYFIHERQDSENRNDGTNERRNAYQDKRDLRWYVPLADALGPVEELDPEDQHRLTLELHLLSGRVVHVQARLRVLGPLPKIGVRRHAIEVPTGTGTFTELLQASAWTMIREEYFNPTRRTLALWVNRGPSRSEVISVVGNQRFDSAGLGEDGKGEEVIRPVHFYFESRGAIDLAALRVVPISGSPGRRGETRALREGTWIRVPIGPWEKLALEWTAGNQGLSSRCQLPGNVPRVFRWNTYVERCRPARIGPGEGGFDLVCWLVPVPHEAHREESHFLYGVGVAGRWNREVRLADASIASTAELEVADSQRVSPLLIEREGRGDFTAGEFPPVHGRFPCQGLF